MSTNEVSPPKNADSVVNTPPVVSESVFEILRKRSADDIWSPTLPHGSKPCVASEILMADSVCGRRERKSAASPSRGGIKIKSTLMKALNTHKYTSMTERMRCMRRLVKKLTAGSIAEAMTTAVTRIRTRSFKNHRRAARAKNISTVIVLPEVKIG